MISAERLVWAVALVLLATHAVLAWLVRAPGILTGGDDAVYVILSRSLRSLGYHNLFYIDASLHHNYPPGHPALLALWGGLVGEQFDRLVVLSIAASTAALAFTFAVLKRLWSPAIALVCLAALAVNFHLIDSAGTLYSEPSYMLFSSAALWILARTAPPPRVLFLAGAVAVAAALTRSVGVTLLVAIGAHWLLERRFAVMAGLAAACAATVVLWLAWSTLMTDEHRPGGSYFADAVYRPSHVETSSFASVLFDRALTNIPAYVSFVFPWQMALPSVPGTRLDNILVMLLTVVGLTVGTWALWKRWRPAALYLLAYSGFLFLWPWVLGRFVNPLLFLLVPSVLLGVYALVGWIRPRWGFAALLGLGLAISLHGAARTALLIRERSLCERGSTLPSPTCVSRDQASFFAALDYIDRSVPEEAVFLVAKAPPLYYYTGRRSVPYAQAIAQHSGDFVDHLRGEGVNYIVLASLHASEPTSLASLLLANCDALDLEAFFPDRTYLFRLRQAGEPIGNEAACAAVADYQRANADRDFSRDP